MLEGTLYFNIMLQQISMNDPRDSDVVWRGTSSDTSLQNLTHSTQYYWGHFVFDYLLFHLREET